MRINAKGEENEVTNLFSYGRRSYLMDAKERSAACTIVSKGFMDCASGYSSKNWVGALIVREGDHSD